MGKTAETTGWIQSEVVNTVVLVGELVDHPELRFTVEGHAYLILRLVMDTPETGAWQDDGFLVGVMRGPRTDRVHDRLEKGSRVFMAGRLTHHRQEHGEGVPYQGEATYPVQFEIEEIGLSIGTARV